MIDTLRICRSNFEPARHAPWQWIRQNYLYVPEPDWLRGNSKDDLIILFRHLQSLFREGINQIQIPKLRKSAESPFDSKHGTDCIGDPQIISGSPSFHRLLDL